MNALQLYQDGGFDTMQRTAKAMVASGYFKDSKDVAQAVVKVMAGAELGIAPFAAMSGVHIVNGKPTLSSNLIATLVKNSGRYDYRVKVATDNECILTWYEHGEMVGESSFTMKEANNAGLTSKAVWKSFASDMLFARALTRGARRYAPGIFGGAPVYTPEEVGADEDIDGGITVTAPPATNGRHAPEAAPAPAPEPEEVTWEELPSEGEARGMVPRDAETVRAELSAAAAANENPASEAQLKYVRSSLSSATENGAQAKAVIKYLTGLDSSKELTAGWASAMIDWIGANLDNKYTPSEVAVQECARIYTAALKDEGQQALL